jgi:hypothetical protein
VAVPPRLTAFRLWTEEEDEDDDEHPEEHVDAETLGLLAEFGEH